MNFENWPKEGWTDTPNGNFLWGLCWKRKKKVCQSGVSQSSADGYRLLHNWTSENDFIKPLTLCPSNGGTQLSVPFHSWIKFHFFSTTDSGADWSAMTAIWSQGTKQATIKYRTSYCRKLFFFKYNRKNLNTWITQNFTLNLHFKIFYFSFPKDQHIPSDTRSHHLKIRFSSPPLTSSLPSLSPPTSLISTPYYYN